AVKAAVEDGLHVLVQGAGWADALGLATTPTSQPISPMPEPRFWVPLYQLRPMERDSLAEWAALPASPGVSTAVPGSGISLVSSPRGPVLQIVPRGKGQILFSGMPSLSALRAP